MSLLPISFWWHKKISAHLGLIFDELNRDNYICDYYNNRIQILSKEFSFKSQFGKDTLKYPRDVKVSQESIYVLDASDPCLHLFSYNHILQKSVISRGTGKEVINPWYFFTDPSSNVLISDRRSNSVLIFSSQFQFIHQISLSSSPLGLTVDTQGRLIVVCHSTRNCLQIY